MSEPDAFVTETEEMIAAQSATIETLERRLAALMRARARATATLEALMMTLAAYQEKHTPSSEGR